MPQEWLSVNWSRRCSRWESTRRPLPFIRIWGVLSTNRQASRAGKDSKNLETLTQQLLSADKSCSQNTTKSFITLSKKRQAVQMESWQNLNSIKQSSSRCKVIMTQWAARKSIDWQTRRWMRLKRTWPSYNRSGKISWHVLPLKQRGCLL